MSNIGIVIDKDELVLTRGRDFKWSFENLDDSKPPQPIDYPPGDLFFEIQTRGEHNALHRVAVKGATGGTYTLNPAGLGNTAAIDYNDVSINPQGLAGDITDAVEAVTGLGNAFIHPVSLFPAWTLNLNLNSGTPLTEQGVNTFYVAANQFFDAFDSLIGVDIELFVTNNLNFKMVVTSRRSFDEIGLATFAVDVVSSAVKTFFNGFAGIIGAVNTVSVDFYWNRTFDIEFVGALAETPFPATTANATGLTGTQKAITVETVDVGKDPLTLWHFDIEGSLANIKIESEQADLIDARTDWQLVFLPAGEPAGGDPVARGRVTVQE